MEIRSIDLEKTPNLMDWANQDLKEKLASEMQVSSGVDRQTITSTAALATLTGKCHFNYISEFITDEKFPDTKVLRRNPKLIDFGRVISSDHALREIKPRVCAPANLRELLIWAAENWDGIERIVALGQVCEGERKVPSVAYLDRLASERRLYVGWRSYDWKLGSKFLVFPV